MTVRVAIFTEVFTPDKNGVSTHTQTLKDGLEKAGHKVLVVTADKRARTHHIDDDNVLRCPAFRMRNIYGFGQSLPLNLKRLDTVEAFAPDIIHIQSEFSLGLSGVHAARKLDVPLVYTVHTMYDDTYVRYVVPERFVKRGKALLYRYIQYLTECAAAVIVPSMRAHRFLADDIGADARKFNRVPNAVDWHALDPQRFSQPERDALHARLGTSPAKRTAIYVGRLGKEKSLDVLLRWWSEAVTPEDGWQLLIIGDGPEAESLHALANHLGIASMITFTGAIENTDVRRFLAIGDVFMTASLSENNSISMLEAMASGLTVLERYDEGTADQIQVGVNGDFFEDSTQMGEKLRRIGGLNTLEMAAQKIRVRASVRQLDTKQMVEKTITVYGKAIAQHGGGLDMEMARSS